MRCNRAAETFSDSLEIALRALEEDGGVAFALVDGSDRVQRRPILIGGENGRATLIFPFDQIHPAEVDVLYSDFIRGIRFGRSEQYCSHTNNRMNRIARRGSAGGNGCNRAYYEWSFSSQMRNSSARGWK